MPHRSRLAGFIIERQGGALAAAGDWAWALGDRKRRKPQGQHVRLDAQRRLDFEVQKVDHPSRVRQRSPGWSGATAAGSVRSAAVMDAPTGHRISALRAQTRGFDAHANIWEGGE